MGLLFDPGVLLDIISAYLNTRDKSEVGVLIFVAQAATA
ncbi:MAG: hypothetical protein AVDCRST_MAG03-679 [uncultured Rubrobacteraceae bacterium]|uniref:Uncharacterized protein n=1 Tax=uncultured Rubrobacteraceae bacterium TaxID=349277 RepID=A0A6J4NQJ4_9ACTN|nr:MAG: hypothetical protein AVDCRST_MAG03-679 [uncultured Rubrobacteraceae bacterium]